jgi:hypothetical protein
MLDTVGQPILTQMLQTLLICPDDVGQPMLTQMLQTLLICPDDKVLVLQVRIPFMNNDFG